MNFLEDFLNFLSGIYWWVHHQIYTIIYDIKHGDPTFWIPKSDPDFDANKLKKYYDESALEVTKKLTETLASIPVISAEEGQKRHDAFYK